MSWNDPNWREAAGLYHLQRVGRLTVVQPSATRTTDRESIDAFYNRIMREHRERNGPTEVELIAQKIREKGGVSR